MLIGIIANITKKNVLDVVQSFLIKLKKNKIDYLLTKSIFEDNEKLKLGSGGNFIINDQEIYEKSDVIISIGGDGTMLATAYNAQFYDKPVLGINLGKLGFLAEANIDQIDKVIDDLRNGNYKIEERMLITGEIAGHKSEKFYSVNDIVIDKGGWPKMIELTIRVDNEFVTTLSADGLIVATPTGSTGYSISVGGPIVSPKTDVITLSPISPHSLTVRPLVLPGTQEIIIKADSLHNAIQVNCDGQRSYTFPPPMEIKIKKNDKPLKLIHTSLTTYFETLRNKLMWGIDLRIKKDGKEE